MDASPCVCECDYFSMQKKDDAPNERQHKFHKPGVIHHWLRCVRSNLVYDSQNNITLNKPVLWH